MSTLRGKGHRIPIHAPFATHAFLAVVDTPKPDRRPTGPTKGSEVALCPTCGAEVSVRDTPGQSNRPDCNREIARHRMGGGRVSLIKGDVPCPGEGSTVRKKVQS